MKSRFLTLLIAILSGIVYGSAFIPTASGQVESWADNTRGSFKWETAGEWSLGVPPSLVQSQVLITNRFVGSLPFARTVSINATTASSFPGTMTISNLTLSSPSATLPNELFVSNTGATPLHIINSLVISNGGVVSITNSTLQVSTFGINGGIFNDGSILFNTGTLITHTSIDSPDFIGYSGVGQMTMLDGLWQAYSIVVGCNVGSQGTLTIDGGIIEDDGNNLAVGSYLAEGGGAGTVWLTGGQLIQTLNSSTTIGETGIGQMTISNGTWQSAASTDVGAQGTLTIAGGSSTFAEGIFVSGDTTVGTGTIWMTGGQLLTSNISVIGDSGPGQMVVSNGTWHAEHVFVGDSNLGPSLDGTGTLTLAGGTNTLTSTLNIGFASGCTGVVWLTGGLLTTLNDTTYVGQDGVGRMTVSNGNWLAKEVDVGGVSFGHMTIQGGSIVAQTMCIGCATNVAVGELMMSGGSLTVPGNLEVGDCVANGFAYVQISGGSAVYVTNASHNAVLDVRNGVFLLEGGTLAVDILVATNECVGTFDHVGGRLTVGTLVLDPNLDTDGDGLPNSWEQAHGLDPLSSIGDNGADGDPDGDGYSNLQEYMAGSDPQNPLSTPAQVVPPPFRITSILRSGNDVVLTWATIGGSTNQVQVTGGTGNGSYATNGFANLGTQIMIGGSGLVTSSYTEVGGATNKPARYYRVRLVP